MNVFLYLCISIPVLAQGKLDRTLKKLNKGSVPYIQIEKASKLTNAILLDTREKEEFDVSHLKDAIWVGYKTFQIDSVIPRIEDKNKTVIVYCSLGVRSENIGEKLVEAGYQDVRNLYGGIFEWKNKGYPIYDPRGVETEKIHAFSKHWGKYLTKGVKVYDVQN